MEMAFMNGNLVNNHKKHIIFFKKSSGDIEKTQKFNFSDLDAY